MKTSIKGLALLFAVLMTLLAVSCGQEKTTEALPSPSAPSEEQSAQPSVLPSLPSASELPSNPQEPSLPEIDPLEKKLNNTATSTEEELKVIPVGVYEFVLEDGRKLAFEGKNVFFADQNAESENNTHFLVSFQNAGTDSTGKKGVRYVIYTGSSVKNSLYCLNNSVSVKESDDRLYNYNWRIEEKEDGTIRLKNIAANTTKYLYVDKKGEVALGTAAQAEGGISLKMNKLDEKLPFRQYISEKGDIVLRISSMVKLKDDRLKKLTNDMQVAYDTYHELTNYLPYESIVIRIYQSEPYFGYVYGGWNVISFNLNNATSDLGMLNARDQLNINDWNFCLLHEMGHMFDFGRGWRFHGEFATNMKVAYVLYANLDVGAAAVTAGHNAATCYKGDEIVNMWNVCPKMTAATGFNLDRVLYLFVSYAESIGWDNVKKAYHEIQAMPTQESNQVKCLELFTSTMAKYAPNGEHVKDTFKEGEWEILLEEIS